MSQDSATATEAARKLTGRRRREVVAVLLFSGGPYLRELHPALRFRDRPAGRGVPRYRLLVCGGEEGPLRTTGGLELTTPYGLEAISRAGTVVVPAWRSITSPPPAEALEALRRAHEEGARIVGLCTGAFVLAAAGPAGRPAGHHALDVRADAGQAPSVGARRSARAVRGRRRCAHLRRHGGGYRSLPPHSPHRPRHGGRRGTRPPAGRAAAAQWRAGALPGQVFTGGDRVRPARRGRGLGPGASARAVRRGDARGARLHEQADLRPQVPFAHRQRTAPVADHPAGASGTEAAGDLRLLGRRGRRPLRIPLPGRAARALPPPARLLPRRVPGRLPGPSSAGGGGERRDGGRDDGAQPGARRPVAGARPCPPHPSPWRRRWGPGEHSLPGPDAFVPGRPALPGQRSAP